MGILTPPPPPHSPIYRQQLLSGLRVCGRREMAEGADEGAKAGNPGQGAALPRYQSFHVPHVDPTLKLASRILWWPKALWLPGNSISCEHTFRWEAWAREGLLFLLPQDHFL